MGLLGLNLALKYYPYFVFGLLIKEFKIIHKNKALLDFGLLMSGVLFFIFVYFWYRMPSKVPSDMDCITKLLNNYESYRFLTALLGCTFFILLFHHFDKIQDRWLVGLGKITLSIYVMNYPLIWIFQIIFGKQVILFENSIVSLFSVLVIVFLSKYLHSLIIKIKYLNVLLLGYINKK